MNHSSSQPGVLLHLGKPYAVGLLWFTVQEQSDPKALLQQRLQKTKADYHCLRTHISQQQAFGWMSKGHRRGMPVAAAMVADQLVGEWHGVFEADNGWWYLQVRSDTITPNGDRFFLSEEEAFRTFQAEMRTNAWPHAYAPAKWNMNEANVRTLELKSVLDDLATTTLVADNITAIFGGTTRRNLIVGGLITTLVLMGGFAAYTITKEPDPIVLPASKITKPVKPIPALEPPKEDSVEIIPVQQLLSACTTALAHLYTPIPGWTSTNFVCKPQLANMTWQQSFGSLTQARETGKAHWPQNVGIVYSNKQMTVSMPLAQLPKVEQSDLLPQEAALLYLEENIQSKGQVRVEPVVPQAPKAPPRTATTATLLLPKSVTQPLPYLNVSVVTGFSPEYMEALSHAKGISLSQIQWAVPTGVWTYDFNFLHARAKVVPAPTPATGSKKP